MDKDEYYSQLYALNESSDDEQDTNDARKVIGQSAQPLSSSFLIPSQPASARRSQTPGRTPRKVPAILRTTSAPVTTSDLSIVRETPLPLKKALVKASKHALKPRYDVSSPLEMNDTFSNQTPATTSPHVPERSASTPNLGFQPILAISNSSGIETMLKKKSTRVDSMLNKASSGKRKRKEKVEKQIVMKPESEQIFAGKTFFFIPADKIAPLRRNRIEDAMSHGAVWAKEWNSEITHIVVDKGYNFETILNFLTPMMGTDSIPEHIALVNQDYPLDCVSNRILVDEKQTRYHIKNFPLPEDQVLEARAAPESEAQESMKNPEFSADQSEPQPQVHSLHASHGSPPPQISPPLDTTAQGGLVESPREMSPITGVDFDADSDLGEWIKFVQSVQDLPVDDVDDDKDPADQNSSNDDNNGSDEEDHPSKKVKKKPKLDKVEALARQGSDAIIKMELNPNRDAIETLQRMTDYYERIKDHWRFFSYRRAIGQLKRCPKKIRTIDQAMEIPFIGESLAKKIEEIVATGHMRKLDNAISEPQDLVLQIFCKVYGVSTQEAGKFMQAGYRTLDDLRTKATLTKGQRIGVDHYEDFNTRIPRAEMTALGTIVKAAAAKIDPEVEAIIGGSYRRGALTSGDIDFIFTKPGTTHCTNLLPFLNSLVDKLTHDGFLTCALATPSHSREDSGSKWHGACVLPGNPIWRRIDFLLVPETELGAALIYFTGDDIFNRSIRLLARHKGCRLNQRGLYKNVLRDAKGLKLSEGELVEGRDERVIFDFLDVPWREPEQRVCH